MESIAIGIKQMRRESIIIKKDNQSFTPDMHLFPSYVGAMIEPAISLHSNIFLKVFYFLYTCGA